jgi:type VI secretion system FHA domain protein
LGDYLLDVLEVAPAAEVMDEGGTLDGSDSFGSWIDRESPQPSDVVPHTTRSRMGAVAREDVPFGERRVGERDAAVQALLEGMGLALEAASIGNEDLRRLGGVVRGMTEGLIALLGARAAIKRELKNVDRTVLSARHNNPLKVGLPIEDVLGVLLTPDAHPPAAYLPFGQALAEATGDLARHELACMAATRALVEGVIGEFDPDRLREALLKGSGATPRFVESARMWSVYREFYADLKDDRDDRIKEWFARYYSTAYAASLERLTRR